MKNLFLFCSFILVISACKDKVIHEHMANVPIYQDYETFRSSIDFESPREISNQIGIYKWNQYLFVVEDQEGIHFIDNSNPSSPSKIGFLSVDGCSGLAVKNNNLFVNNLIDVAVIDISNINNPTIISRLQNIFPQNYPLGDNNLPYQKVDTEKGVVIGWEQKEVKEEVQNSPNYGMLNSDAFSFSGGAVTSGSGMSISGSITKFALVDNYLYIMEGNNLHPIDISSPNNLVNSSPVRIFRTVETLFPHGDKIYMGTTTGMMIYSTTQPDQPGHLGTIEHTTACDPVVVQGDYAYVTIRSGTTCLGEINELDVVDISDPTAPVLESRFELANPHGLGVDGTNLFVCDGSDGLKVFDCSNPLTAGDNLTQSFSDIVAIDIIPNGGIAIVLTEDGIYQYDCSNPQNIQYLSKIQ